MFNKRSRKRKGQSTVEYLVVVAGVIAALIVFLAPGGPFNTEFGKALNAGTDGMVNMANRLRGSRN